MDVRRLWRRLDAEHWIHVCGMAVTALLVIGAFVALLGGFAAGAPVAAVPLAALAGLSGWLTSAWRRERPWAWWVWTVGSGVEFATALDALVSGRLLGAVGLAAGGILLALLLHPDSRARIEPPAATVR